jgi:hypothetical protein
MGGPYGSTVCRDRRRSVIVRKNSAGEMLSVTMLAKNPLAICSALPAAPGLMRSSSRPRIGCAPDRYENSSPSTTALSQHSRARSHRGCAAMWAIGRSSRSTGSGRQWLRSWSPRSATSRGSVPPKRCARGPGSPPNIVSRTPWGGAVVCGLPVADQLRARRGEAAPASTPLRRLVRCAPFSCRRRAVRLGHAV